MRRADPAEAFQGLLLSHEGTIITDRDSRLDSQTRRVYSLLIPLDSSVVLLTRVDATCQNEDGKKYFVCE